jgi:hypothetical protein
MCVFLLALIEQERPMGFICISPGKYEIFCNTRQQIHAVFSSVATCKLSEGF